MAKNYYDSAFTGAQIDAAVRAAGSLSQAAVIANAGKYLAVDTDGNVKAVNAPEGYDDTALSQRVTELETAISGLRDATGEAF